MPKFSFHEYIDVPIIYRDIKTRVSLKCGKSRCFNSYSIELIQLIAGEDNLYIEFLNKGREGFHHVDILVYGIDDYINLFCQKGINVIQEGKSLRKWAYMDTEKFLGFIIELVDAAPPRRRRKQF